jgi:hypothetical protein
MDEVTVVTVYAAQCICSLLMILKTSSGVFLQSINRLAFVMGTQCVFCEMGIQLLIII